MDRSISLRIDNEDPKRDSIGSGNNAVLDVSSPLFVGGINNDKMAEARRMWHVRNSTTFIGKLQSYHLINPKIHLIYTF